MIVNDCVSTDERAVCELRKMIREHLVEEIEKLKNSVTQQLKQSEEEMNRKLDAVELEGGPGDKGGKGKLSPAKTKGK